MGKELVIDDGQGILDRIGNIESALYFIKSKFSVAEIAEYRDNVELSNFLSWCIDTNKMTVEEAGRIGNLWKEWYKQQKVGGDE